jgi:hypothetical protein
MSNQFSQNTGGGQSQQSSQSQFSFFQQNIQQQSPQTQFNSNTNPSNMKITLNQHPFPGGIKLKEVENKNWFNLFNKHLEEESTIDSRMAELQQEEMILINELDGMLDDLKYV